MRGWKEVAGALAGRIRRPGTISRLARAELAAAVRARPPLPLFRHQVTSRPERAIEQLRRDGWVVRGKSFDTEPPIDWGADPFGDHDWRFRLNAMYFVVPFLQADDKTGDPDALRQARRVLLDWVTYNLVEDRPNPYRWYDFGAGLRAAHLAYVLDRSLRHGTIPAKELDLLLLMAREHFLFLTDRRELASNNHAYFQLVGLAGLSRAIPGLRGAGAAVAYASREFGRLVERQFTADAINTENSPFYHAYALQAIAAVTDTGWFDLPPPAAARIEQAWENLPWMIRPDGRFAAIGDSSAAPPTRVKRRLEELRLGPRHGHRAFRRGGYAVVRAPGPDGLASDGYLFLTAAYHSRAHKHRDALSFEWFDRGAPRLVDAGAYSANRDARRDYARSTRAHNTVEVDGRDVDGGPPREPTRLATAQAGALFCVAAEVEHPELAVRHRRILLYRPGSWLLVHDDLDADRDRTCTAWFHLAPGAPGVALHDLDGGAAVERVCGALEPRLQGWITTSYGELTAAEAVGFTRSGRHVIFSTLCLLDDDGGPPPTLVAPSVAAKDGIDLRWSRGGANDGAIVTVRDGTLRLTIT